MKSKINLLFIFLIVSSLFSCTSMKINLGLKLIGAYDEVIILEKLKNQEKEIIFFPMVHIGTENFYNDVKMKIDSLEKIGFITYYEKVDSEINDTLNQRKLKKITGFPIPKRGRGYMSILDSVFKGKLKKKLISQPNYSVLGVDSLKGTNVDVNLKQLIAEFERRYGKINLEECDFKTSIHSKTVCKDETITDKQKDEVILGYRNDYITSKILNGNINKLILIYGKEHFIGIRKNLQKDGFLINK